MSERERVRDVYAGLLFIGFGLVALVLSREYSMGMAARMGPAYFPRILGGLLVALGAAIALGRRRAPRMGGWAWKPLGLVLGSVVLFGLTIQALGLALSTLLLVGVASAASRQARWREMFVAGAVLALVSIGAFVYALGLPMPVWPGG